MASLVLNCLTFPFTMRPRRAILAILLWIPLGLGSLLFLDHISPQPPDYVLVVWFVIFGFGPVLVNAALYVRHEMLIGKPVNPVHHRTSATEFGGGPLTPR